MDYLLSFSSGLLSFLSPCVLPLLPAYLGYIAGSQSKEKDTHYDAVRMLIRTLIFSLGFTVIFVALGAAVTAFSKLLNDNLVIFRRIGGALIIILGIHMTGIIKIKPLMKEKKISKPKATGSVFEPFVLGMIFAIGWTPCIGPVLASILIYAGAEATAARGIIMLILYSSGLAVPFLICAMLTGHITYFLQKFRKFIRFVPYISGALMIVMGILMITGHMSLGTSCFARGT
jgi:cytochrome c-type biogenesis protein